MEYNTKSDIKNERGQDGTILNPKKLCWGQFLLGEKKKVHNHTKKVL